MNRSFEPQVSIVEYFDALAYGAHSSGLVKLGASPYEARHACVTASAMHKAGAR
ncbi:hypothetical protein [Mycobacteroides chelonae]|uniref:hypothetical protein n=1 Tax=Mycobacteroides chelonae TaxID=1774 RepID=UPI0018B0186D|nr:hypothetical protein [Mycobacteroides chelonae]MBF9328519.1 hypothetical protein [Mycobacteroides chelonae]MBF9422697.1 hypothetical protein [Mycobacteroides chelonae]